MSVTTAVIKGPDETVPGVLLVDKPEGPTSHDVVRLVRRALRTRRVGHTGTLDPFASGLLILCVGRATRLSGIFHLLPKRYQAEVELGLATTTDDRTGEPLAGNGSWSGISRADVEAALVDLTGELSQVPPIFSAKKLEGHRAHRLARAGSPVELEPAIVTVHSIEITDWSPPSVSLDLWVSTGTYVRALARDLGQMLGCGAHLASLRRTQIGPFEVGAGLSAAEIGRTPDSDAESVPLVPPLRALEWLPSRRLEPSEAEDVSHGRSVPEGAVEITPTHGYPVPDTGSWPVALVHRDALVAVAERKDGVLRPIKVLHAA